LKGRVADVGISDEGDRTGDGTEGGARLARESELVNEVFSLAVGVVVDVQLVENIVREIEVVRPVGRVLAWNHVHDQGHALVRGCSVQVSLVIADESIDVRNVGRRILGDKRRLAVACAEGRGCQ